MQAWILDAVGQPYRWGELTDPECGPGEVLVRPVASALNHMDLWVARGLPEPALPHVPGADAAGFIEAVGAEVSGLAVGDEVVIDPTLPAPGAVEEWGIDAPVARGTRILGEHRWGAHATRVVVPAANAVARPPGRSWAECAAYPTAWATAWRLLRRARVTAGERVLVVGIGGGVSLACLAVARHLGAEVHVTTRDPAKGDWALDHGAVAWHDSAAERWNVTAEVVVESVGPATWKRSVAALARGGRLAVCGGTSGREVTVHLPTLFFRQHEIIGSTMASPTEFAELTAAVAAGLEIHIDRTVPLSDYPGALERLAAGDQVGKLVLDHPGSPNR